MIRCLELKPIVGFIDSLADYVPGSDHLRIGDVLTVKLFGKLEKLIFISAMFCVCSS